MGLSVLSDREQGFREQEQVIHDLHGIPKGNRWEIFVLNSELEGTVNTACSSGYTACNVPIMQKNTARRKKGEECMTFISA
jgi:hypothetical protein